MYLVWLYGLLNFHLHKEVTLYFCNLSVTFCNIRTHHVIITLHFTFIVITLLMTFPLSVGEVSTLITCTLIFSYGFFGREIGRKPIHENHHHQSF